MTAFKPRPATSSEERDRAHWVPVISYSGKPAAPATTDLLPTTALARCGELPRRAVAAARLAMPDRKVYSEEDVCEVASEIVARLLREASPAAMAVPMDRVQVQRARDSSERTDLLRWLQTAERDAPRRADAVALDPERCEVRKLYNTAVVLRRSIDRDRNRDAQAAGETAASTAFRPQITTPDPETCRTPDGAAHVALAMLESAGCRPLRKGDAPLYSLAYSAARASAGLESGEIAEELALSPAAQRQHLSRASAKLRKGPHAPHDWAHALALPDGGTERAHAAPLPDSNGARLRPGDVFPNASAERRTAPLAQVHERRMAGPHRPPWTPGQTGAGWTNGLPAGSRSRLAAQASRQRDRAQAKPDAKRAADRTAAGLPGTVR